MAITRYRQRLFVRGGRSSLFFLVLLAIPKAQDDIENKTPLWARLMEEIENDAKRLKEEMKQKREQEGKMNKSTANETVYRSR